MPDESMSEHEGKIVIASSGTSIEDLKKRAGELNVADVEATKARAQQAARTAQAKEIGQAVGDAVAEKVGPADTLRSAAEAIAASAALLDEAGELKGKSQGEPRLPTSSPTGPESKLGSEKEERMTWMQSQGILENYAEKLATEKKITAREESEADKAIEQRDRMVSEAKSQGLLDREMKDAVANMMDRINIDYYQDVASGRNENPRDVLAREIEGEMRTRGEPEGELAGIRKSWYEGILRNVDIRIIGGQIAMRRTLNMADDPALQRDLKGLEARAGVLNWGGNTEETQRRLSQLARAVVDWQQNFSTEADDYKKAVEALKAQFGMSGRELESYPITPPPTQFVAIFREGRYGMYERAWKEKVKFLSVLSAEDRKIWCYANMAAFTNGIIPSPDQNWKVVIDTWLSDLDDATRLSKVTSDQLKGIEVTKKEMRAMMAISASARAMEQSGGAASTYVELLTGAKGGNLDRQDSWAEYLLHKDSEKYWTVISNPLVKHYYDRLLADAGIIIWPGEESGEGENKVSKIRPVNVDWSKAFAGKLVEYLRTKKDGEKGFVPRGGFNPYIKEVLLADDDETFIQEQSKKEIGEFERWSAARLACDAFLIDKYTRWEFEITSGGNLKTEDKLMMLPFAGWGGDPLRMVLQPSFLSRVIKKVYGNEDAVIMNMTDKAFRPDDIFSSLEKVEAIPASMVGHLKDYARYSDALWKFLGGSRAPAVPQWTNDVMGKDLPAIAELLDQVYGVKGEDGKQVVGAMMARILETKALAAAVETAKPGAREALKLIFGEKEEEARPFLNVMKFIWGPEIDSKGGFLHSLAAGRTHFVFRDNKYGAEKALNETYKILLTNDQEPSRNRAIFLQTLRSGVEIAKAISQVFGGSRRQ